MPLDRKASVKGETPAFMPTLNADQEWIAHWQRGRLFDPVVVPTDYEPATPYRQPSAQTAGGVSTFEPVDLAALPIGPKVRALLAGEADADLIAEFNAAWRSPGMTDPDDASRSRCAYLAACELLKAGVDEVTATRVLSDRDLAVSAHAWKERGEQTSVMAWTHRYAVQPAMLDPRTKTVRADEMFETVPGTVQLLTAETAEWPDPEPLIARPPDVAPFHLNLLPEALRPWIQDTAERMQCPPDFPAVGAMVALGTIVGRQVGILPKQADDWTVVPNLFGGVVGRPSVLKTPALAEALIPLTKLEESAREEHTAAVQAYQTQVMVAEIEEKERKNAIARALKAGNSALAIQIATQAPLVNPVEPVRRRYLTQDPTVEKLGELLRDNPNGLLVFRDELSGLLRSLDREGQESARSFYLEGWNGTGSYTYDRIGRGTVEIEAVCLSLLGGIQPGPLSEYVMSAVRGGTGDDGLMQRLQLLVWPNHVDAWRYIDRRPDRVAREAAYAVYERVKALVPGDLHTEPGRGGIPCLRFAQEAQDRYVGWLTDLEVRLRGDILPRFLEAHLAKYRSLVPSLALLCHLADHAEGGPVGIDSLARAIDWAGYLETHARRVYSPAVAPAVTAAVELLKHLKELSSPFKARDVYRNGWRYLDREVTTGALAVLEDHHLVRSERVAAAVGRPTVRYWINPEHRR